MVAFSVVILLASELQVVQKAQLSATSNEVTKINLFVNMGRWHWWKWMLLLYRILSSKTCQTKRLFWEGHGLNHAV